MNEDYNRVPVERTVRLEKKMFLMIHESGDMVRVQNLTENDLAAADDGLVDLLDVSEAGNPKRYDEGEWHELEIASA